MKMTKKLGLASLCLAMLVLSSAAYAEPITYAIHVDTSSIFGTSGFVDLQLNPQGSPGTFDTVTALAFGFSSTGTLGAVDGGNIGNTAGDLASNVNLDTGAGLADFAQNYTFSSFFDVFVTLDMPTVTPLTEATDFYVNVYDGGYGQLLGGPASHVLIDVDGSQTILAGSEGSTTTEAPSVPEPTTMLLLASGLAGAWIKKRRTAK